MTDRTFYAAMVLCIVTGLGAVFMTHEATAQEPGTIQVPYASQTEFDTEPPRVKVQPSAWPWPTCDESDVTGSIVQRFRNDLDADMSVQPKRRMVVWVFKDKAGNQTVVIRQEFTWVLHGPFGSLEGVF